MKRSTRRLIDDHDLILRAIEAISVEAKNTTDSGNFNESFWIDSIDFIKNFADGIHHNKEENHLFEIYSQRGIGKEFGPVAVMLNEHIIGRVCVNNMESALQNGKTDVQKLVSSAREYCELLVQHIAKENQILFPLGETVISDSDEILLNTLFDDAELELGGNQTILHYQNLVISLEERAGIVEVVK